MDDGDNDSVHLPYVNEAIFKKVIQWCTNRNNDPLPPPKDAKNKEKLRDNILVWDQELLKVDQAMFFELFLATNYLDIKDSLDVTCKTVADMYVQGENS